MIPDCNLFMMCESLNKSALTDVPAGYHIRFCRKNEIDLWKSIHFDTKSEANENLAYMDGFFNRVYAPEEDLFFRTCLFICDENDQPLGACLAWKVFGFATTIHWFKVHRSFEGRGLGRALLSEVMRRLNPDDYPVFLHTQPSSYRAIKLYSDFGFALVQGDKVGHRSNALAFALPHLKNLMPAHVFDQLRFSEAPDWFLEAANSVSESVF